MSHLEYYVVTRAREINTVIGVLEHPEWPDIKTAWSLLRMSASQLFYLLEIFYCCPYATSKRNEENINSTLGHIRDFGESFHCDGNSLMAAITAACVLCTVLLDKPFPQCICDTSFSLYRLPSLRFHSTAGFFWLVAELCFSTWENISWPNQCSYLGIPEAAGTNSKIRLYETLLINPAPGITHIYLCVIMHAKSDPNPQTGRFDGVIFMLRKPVVLNTVNAFIKLLNGCNGR